MRLGGVREKSPSLFPGHENIIKTQVVQRQNDLRSDLTRSNRSSQEDFPTRKLFSGITKNFVDITNVFVVSSAP